jgi:hypothetical protein
VPDYDKDDGTSLKAIKKAFLSSSFNFQPCLDEENCFNDKEGYMTLHEDNSKNFFDFIYILDELYKFDHKQKHVYTVKPNESFPIDKYADDTRYCIMVENGVREHEFHTFSK